MATSLTRLKTSLNVDRVSPTIWIDRFDLTWLMTNRTAMRNRVRPRKYRDIIILIAAVSKSMVSRWVLWTVVWTGGGVRSSSSNRSKQHTRWWRSDWINVRLKLNGKYWPFRKSFVVVHRWEWVRQFHWTIWTVANDEQSSVASVYCYWRWPSIECLARERTRLTTWSRCILRTSAEETSIQTRWSDHRIGTVEQPRIEIRSFQDLLTMIKTMMDNE